MSEQLSKVSALIQMQNHQLGTHRIKLNDVVHRSREPSEMLPGESRIA